MKVKLDNLFTSTELEAINEAISIASTEADYDQELGRKRLEGVRVPHQIEEKLTLLVQELTGRELKMNLPPQYVEYNSSYGAPNLRPHFDRDFNDYIIDYQLNSNTTWPLGVDLSVYPLEDNSAVAFNPNTNIHWRPRKEFQPGEYVQMMFFRFFDPVNKSDYSYLPHNPADSVFDEVNALRDSL